METKTDRVTPVARERNPTAFAYWNVASAGSGSKSSFPLLPSVQTLFAFFCALRACWFKRKPRTPNGGKIKRCQ
jgi:hypothetical protein